MRIWQVLPLGPAGSRQSPYQLFSAFAGNPLLLSLDRLLPLGELENLPRFSEESVEFEEVVPWKTAALHRAFDRFQPDRDFDSFCINHAAWLDDFARFMALKDANGGVHWSAWDPKLEASTRDIAYHKFLQYEFFRQWRALKRYCAGRGIRMMGDLAIYLATGSADVWAHPELCRFDRVAGVPPDYFSATGQLWGNPPYRWDVLAKDGYRWWIERMRAALALFDLVRMDHFRGFEAFWEVPASAPTAIDGQWVKGPGAELLRALETALGRLPLVAENLG